MALMGLVCWTEAMIEVVPGPRQSSTANPTTDVDAAYQTMTARSARPFPSKGAARPYSWKPAAEGSGPRVPVAR
jgi:hypothetical protein